MSQAPAALDLREPGLADVLGDVDALSLWELLRRAGRPLEAESLAERSGRALAAVQERLDRLAEAGLVARRRATARSPRIRWQVTRQTIVVGYRVNDPVDEALNESIGSLFSSERREAIDRHRLRGASAKRHPDRWSRVWCGRLSREEILVLWDLFQRLERLHLASGNRAAAAGGDPSCTHHIDFFIRPLAAGVLPLPEILAQPIDAHGAAVWMPWHLATPTPHPTEAMRALTERERRVAVLLLEEGGRDAIARRLGISKNTLLEHIRRIQRKLKTRSRRELRELFGPLRDGWAVASEGAIGDPQRDGNASAEGQGVAAAEALDLRRPGLLEALSTHDPLAIWESLRRLARPATVEDLVKASRFESTRVRAALEALLAPGRGVLVEQENSRGRPKSTRWRTARASIVVAHRLDDREDQASVEAIARIFCEERRREIREHAKSFKTRSPDEFFLQSMHAGACTREELHRIWDLVPQFERLFREASRRWSASPLGDDPWCTYHVTLDLEPLRPGVLPTPTMQVMGMRWAGKTARSFPERIEELSTRERQVAFDLAHGRSQRGIAAEMGVSYHTVVTLTRRCYAKLGVRSKAALVKALGVTAEED